MLDFAQETEYKDMDFTKLTETCKSCQKCELSETRQNVVVGYGPVPCNLMAIGEGPGEQEDLQAKPFIGRAGQLLTQILGSIEIDRETDIYITNIVKCRPPKNRNPLPTEIEACKPYLIRQIQIVKPKVLIVLGAPSLKTILESDLTISKARGKWYKAEVDYMDDLLYIMPLFHPSYLLRNARRDKGSPKWLTWMDMKEIKAALDFYTAA
jgi:uracil-DNA glycosylase